MPKPLTDAINALTTYANSVTGASDTTLSEAVATLANGYGGGGKHYSLPTDYQEVEYLVMTQNCYFNLGMRAYFNIGYSVDFLLYGRYNQYGPHLISTNTNYCWFVPRTADTMVKFYNTETLFPVSQLNTRYSVKVNHDGNGKYINGDTEVTLPTKGNAINAQTFEICAYASGTGQSGYHMNGELYHVTLYNNGVLVEDFVPCYRKSDSVAGLYDIVNGIFYTNGGNGTITVGADV